MRDGVQIEKLLHKKPYQILQELFLGPYFFSNKKCIHIFVNSRWQLAAIDVSTIHVLKVFEGNK